MRLSSIKLRLKIFKKRYLSTKKIIKLRKLGKTNNESFSLKNFITLCNEKNINIKLFTKEDSINKYLSTVVVDK